MHRFNAFSSTNVYIIWTNMLFIFKCNIFYYFFKRLHLTRVPEGLINDFQRHQLQPWLLLGDRCRWWWCSISWVSRKMRNKRNLAMMIDDRRDWLGRVLQTLVVLRICYRTGLFWSFTFEAFASLPSILPLPYFFQPLHYLR